MITEVIAYLNQIAGTQYDSQNKETIKCLESLIGKGYGFDDFKLVIDKKWYEWKGTDYQTYVRPSTLFGNKFERYLHEQPRAKSTIHKYARAVNKAKSANWRLDSK